MRTVHPLGTTIYDPDRCYNGYTVLNCYSRLDPGAAARVRQAAGGQATPASSWAEVSEDAIAVIDMNGNLVHGWNVQAFRQPKLFRNGNILLAEKAPESNPTGLYAEGPAREYDWDRNLVWECHAPVSSGAGSEAMRLENGNTVFFYKMLLPDRWREKIADPKRRNWIWDGVLSDCIVEVTADKDVVWNWVSHEHIDINMYMEMDASPNWTHCNSLQPLPENRWYDRGDERFRPGNLLVSPRNLGFIFIIDKETGDIVWRYSGDYGGGLAGQHSPQMIEKGIPGEGNIVVFDNGTPPLRNLGRAGITYVLEIDPVRKKVVWAYDNGPLFYASFGGHVERLPNGNTLIAETYPCRAFEVTVDGEIVWEYVRDPARWTLIMDATRVPYDHCPQLAELPRPMEVPVVPPPHAVLKSPTYRAS